TSLREHTYGQDETRSLAWSTIAMAEAFLGLEEYQEAMSKAEGALIACYHIYSLQNVTMIADLYHRLVAKTSGASTEMQELGAMLGEWYDIPHQERRLT